MAPVLPHAPASARLDGAPPLPSAVSLRDAARRAPVLPHAPASARLDGAPPLPSAVSLRDAARRAPVLPHAPASARLDGSPPLPSADLGRAHRFVSTRSFSLKRWSLPVAVRGSSLTMRMS